MKCCTHMLASGGSWQFSEHKIYRKPIFILLFTNYLLYCFLQKLVAFAWSTKKNSLQAHWTGQVEPSFLTYPVYKLYNIIHGFIEIGLNSLKSGIENLINLTQFFFARYLKSNWKLGTITILVSIYIRWDKLNFKLVRNTKTILLFSNWINGETCITGKRS